jgi:hypothetical protein
MANPFLPVHPHRRGRRDAQINPFLLNRRDDHPDFLANHDLFTETPTEY